MISIDCDRCGATLGVDDKYAGQTARCAQCSAEIQVPQRETMTPKTPRWPFFRSIVRARAAQRRRARSRKKRSAMHAAAVAMAAKPSKSLPRFRLADFVPHMLACVMLLMLCSTVLQLLILNRFVSSPLLVAVDAPASGLPIDIATASADVTVESDGYFGVNVNNISDIPVSIDDTVDVSIDDTLDVELKEHRIYSSDPIPVRIEQ